ncbi:MAG: glutamate synthase subunit beta [Bacteroidota bacterium]
MGDPRGFMKYDRELPGIRSPKSRIKDYKEIYEAVPESQTRQQAARCMDCGIPFCHNGCPLGNVIPEFNEAAQSGDWKLAYEILSSTNNFPEFTGRICPAPCEAACVLGINQPAVAIEHIEKSIIEYAFDKGLVRPKPPALRTGKKVAIIGSGPAGLAAAAQLNKAGHIVTVFERDDRIGGLLRYGIPDFKLEKWVLERRLAILEAEGIRFRTNANVGVNVDSRQLLADFDALILCGGSTVARDLQIPGRELEGLHFAMEFLKQSNQRVAGDHIAAEDNLLANRKHVIVIGGGDTGSDCVGTSNRHQAASITQLELLGKPPSKRSEDTPWPLWPMQLRTSSSHEEGCERQWAILTKAFLGDDKGRVRALQVVEVEWKIAQKGQKAKFVEVAGTEREIPADLVFLAMGYTHPQFEGLLDQLGVALDQSGNVQDHHYQTNLEKVFVAGDMRRGQSLVVWAISEGREAARQVDCFLMGSSMLESKDESFLSQ